ERNPAVRAEMKRGNTRLVGCQKYVRRAQMIGHNRLDGAGNGSHAKEARGERLSRAQMDASHKQGSRVDPVIASEASSRQGLLQTQDYLFSDLLLDLHAGQRRQA